MVIVSVFRPFLLSLVTSLNVWCTCKAFIWTEQADGDGDNPHTGDVFFESVTDWRSLKTAACFCVNNIKLTKGGLLMSLQHVADMGSLCKNSYKVTWSKDFSGSLLQETSSLSFLHSVQQTIICSGSFSRAHRIAPVQILHADTNQTNDCMQIRVSVEEIS